MSRLFAPALLLAVSASLSAGPPTPAPAPGACGGTHVVVRGDTLYSIARRCRSTVVAIAGASRLADPRRIEIGQRLVIPGREAPVADEADKPEAAPAPPSAPPPATELAYRFQPGDTIYSLARWARTSVGALFAANPGLDPHKIEIGDEIRLPAGAIAPGPGRRREFGTGPGPALVRPELLRHLTAAPPPQARPLPPPAPVPAPRARDSSMGPPPRHAPPPPPRRGKPDDEGPDTPGL
jgi:LysM repeat protein